jgi:hypothetical protein
MREARGVFLLSIEDRNKLAMLYGVTSDWTGTSDAGRFGVVVVCHAISRAFHLLHSCN